EPTESRSTRGQTGWSRRVVPLDGVTEPGVHPHSRCPKKWESRSRERMSPSATTTVTTPTTPPRHSRGRHAGRPRCAVAWRTHPTGAATATIGLSTGRHTSHRHPPTTGDHPSPVLAPPIVDASLRVVTPTQE